jgi:signal transduction histidine kinase/ActR/RegA family two-component response regulator
MGLPRWIPCAIWLVAAAFALGVLGTAQSLISSSRNEALEQGRSQTERVLAGAEAALNRTLLSVDVMLSGVEDLVRPATSAGGKIDPAQAQVLLVGLVKRNLLVRDITLLGARGETLASTQTQHLNEPAPHETDPRWPPQFISRVWAQPTSSLVIGPAMRSPSTSETVVHLARPTVSGNGQRAMVVAEVPLQLVASVLAPGATVEGMQITLERDDGQLLASVPPSDITGTLNLSPPLSVNQADGQVRVGLGRPNQREALIAVRSSLYGSVLLSSSISMQDVLRRWHTDKRKTTIVAAVFLSTILLAAGFVHWHWARLSRARQDTVNSKALLDQALSSMSDGFLLCDSNDRVLVWNQRYAVIFPWLKDVIARGVPFEVLIRRSVGHYLPGADAAQREAWIKRRMQAHGSEHGDFEQDIGNGMVVHAKETRMPDGGVVSVFRDITASERELARAKAAAEAANESKTQFLAAMSHEIRTPLNAVLGMNGLLLNTPLTQEQRRYVELIRSSGQMLLAVINDVLDISKIEAARMELEIAEFSPRMIIEEVASLLSVRAQAKGLQFHTHLSLNLPGALRGDASRLRQILFNLIGNALKFTEQGQVEVTVDQQPMDDGRFMFCVAVKDSGIGIAPGALPTLFDRFTQADSSTARRYGGSGLGLAISKELVTLMGGTLSVESALGVGSTFELRVPLAAGDSRKLVQMDASGEIAQRATRSLRILVAEDNGVNQILIKAILDQMGHYSDIVADGIEAVRQVQQAQYDLILMDIQMPEMDGQAATKAIRELEGSYSSMPIIAMTANAMVQDRNTYLGAGMTDYVSKPIVVRQLALAIEKASHEKH